MHEADRPQLNVNSSWSMLTGTSIAQSFIIFYAIWTPSCLYLWTENGCLKATDTWSSPWWESLIHRSFCPLGTDPEVRTEQFCVGFLKCSHGWCDVLLRVGQTLCRLRSVCSLAFLEPNFYQIDCGWLFQLPDCWVDFWNFRKMVGVLAVWKALWSDLVWTFCSYR